MQNQNEETKTTKPANLSRYLIKAIVLLVTITLVCLILFPPKPRNKIAKMIVCKSNLKGIALAIKLYTAEHEYRLSSHEKWNDLLTLYHKNNKILRCPAEKNQDDNICTYVLNNNVKKLKPPVPSDLVIAFEGPTGWNQTGGSEMIVYRHIENTKCNVLLADGTVIEVNETEAANLKWKPTPTD